MSKGIGEIAEHSAPVVGESLFVWGGVRPGYPKVHESPQKMKLYSTIDRLDFRTGSWSSHVTRGTSPPLGPDGYFCTVRNNDIFYMGGYCGHDDCFHNDVNLFNTLTYEWNKLMSSSDIVMKRGAGGMVCMESMGTEYLLAIGGHGSTPTTYQSQYQYDQIYDGDVRTNEHNLLNLSTRQWIIPTISGQCCPPTSVFTLTKISNNKSVLFGGAVTDDEGYNLPVNNVYTCQLESDTTIHWESVKGPVVPASVQWPVERHGHAITSIISDSPTLVMIGGMDQKNQLVNDSWLLDTSQYQWSKIVLPESVTGRRSHSISSIMMSPDCVWLVVVGGSGATEWKDVGRGVKEPFGTYITDPNITMLIELVLTKGQWTVSEVLDSTDLTKEAYQHKYQSFLKTRQWWQDRCSIVYPTEKEVQQQQYIQVLQHELRVFEVNKTSLQEALLQASQQGDVTDDTYTKTPPPPASVDDSKLKSSIQEWKNITEEIEKMKALIDKKDIIITNQAEEKTLTNEENEKLKANITMLTEEKSQLEEKNENSTGKIEKLEVQVSDKDMLIAKLMKKESQLKEELQSMKDTTTAEDNEKQLKEREPVKDIGIQFDYIVPSMDNLECLSDVNIASKKLFLIQGDRPQLLNWERYGLRIGVSGGSLSSTETAEVAVVALVGGQFVFPKKTVLVSAVYAVSVSRPLLKALRLEMQHCVDLSRGVKTKYLKFAIAPVSTASLPYHFSIVDGGEFSEGKWYGSINREKFCLVSIVGSLTNGGGEEEGQEGEGNGGETNGGNENGGGRQQHLEGDGAREQQGAAIVEEKEEGEGGEKQKNEGKEQEQDSTGQEMEGGQGQETEKEEGDIVKEKSSTGVSESMTYAGIVYYEVKGVEDLVTFAAAKNLNALLEYVKEYHCKAEMGQNVYFCFDDSFKHIELLMDEPQTEPFTGWKIKPHFKPCRLRKTDIDNFGKKDYPLPPTCLISVYGSPAPGTEAMLHYAIPLDGVDDPVTIFIHRSLRTAPTTVTTPSVDTSDTTTSNNRPTEATASTTGTGTVDLDIVKGKVKDVLMKNQVALKEAFRLSLQSISDQLLQVGIISQDIHRSPTYDDIIGSFLAGLTFIRRQSKLKERCDTLIGALSNVGGPVADAADMLREDWEQAMNM